MKRILAAILSLTLIIAMASCSSTPNSSSQSQPSASSKETASKSVSVAAASSEPSTYTITLPASLFQGQNIDDVIANAKKQGVSEVTKNADGSITYKMDKATHDALITTMKQSMQTAFDNVKSGESFKSIKDIKYNNDYSEITVIVDKSKFESSLDGLALLGIYISVAYYNIFNGEKPENAKVTFKIQDQATSQVFQTIVYPDDLKTSSK